MLPLQHICCEVGSLSKTGPFVLDARLSQLDPSPTAQSQHIIGLLPKSQMWPGTPRTDGPNHIGMPSQTIQQPAGADWRIEPGPQGAFAVPPRIMTRVFRSAAKFSRATADVVSMAIAINPVDKSLIVVIELSF
jgi:hypothetical protein